MADERGVVTRPKRARQPPDGAHDDGQAHGKNDFQAEHLRTLEAAALIRALHSLRLISPSSRPDCRSIAFAVAALRNQLQGSLKEQADFFNLSVRTIRVVMNEWVHDVDTRLQQAMQYIVLPPAERAVFHVSRPSTDELTRRDAKKRQDAEDGAFRRVHAHARRASPPDAQLEAVRHDWARLNCGSTPNVLCAYLG